MKTSNVREIAEYLRKNQRKCGVCGGPWDQLILPGGDVLCDRCVSWAYHPPVLEEWSGNLLFMIKNRFCAD